MVELLVDSRESKTVGKKDTSMVVLSVAPRVEM